MVTQAACDQEIGQIGLPGPLWDHLVYFLVVVGLAIQGLWQLLFFWGGWVWTKSVLWLVPVSTCLISQLVPILSTLAYRGISQLWKDITLVYSIPTIILLFSSNLHSFLWSLLIKSANSVMIIFGSTFLDRNIQFFSRYPIKIPWGGYFHAWTQMEMDSPILEVRCSDYKAARRCRIGLECLTI